MRNFHLILILIAALYTALPTGSPFRPLFDLVGGGEDSGDITIQSDPETEPTIINLPPPR